MAGIFACTSALIIPNYACAQTTDSSSLLLHQKAAKDYLDWIKENASFFTGSEYTARGRDIVGHPFFEKSPANRSELNYDGVDYYNIPLLYDLYADALILQDHSRNYNIQLGNSKIGHFKLDQTLFIKQGLPSSGKNNHDGFFQVLYSGKVQALAKKKKMLVHRTNAEKTISSYQPYNTYYLVKDKEWWTIKSKKDLIHALADRKTAIRKFLTESHITFKEQPETLIAKTVSFYDHLQ